VRWNMTCRSVMSSRIEDDLITFGFLHDGKVSPGLLLGRALKVDAFRFEFVVSLVQAVDFPGGVDKGTDAVFVSFGGEKHDTGFCAGNRKFDPALGFGEVLIGENAEAEFFGIKTQGALLISDGDTEKFDALDHVGQHASFRMPGAI